MGMIDFARMQALWARRPSARWLLLWTGFAFAVAGFLSNGLWHVIGWAPTMELARLALLTLLVAVAVRRFTGQFMATSAAIVWLIALVYFGGIASCFAVALLALASMALGSMVIPSGWGARGAISTLVGLALIVGVAGWLLPFPVHYRAVYVVLLLAMLVLRWRAVGEMLHPLASRWSNAVALSPRAACLGVMVVGLISTSLWMPTIHYDDLSYHLGLPSQLISLGYYQMNAGSNVWAVAPWAADVLQGITWLIAGQESRGAVDGLWLLLTLVLMWQLCAALELPPWARWMALALYASLPLTVGTLTGMQTEGPTAATAVAIAWLIQRSPGPDRRQLTAMAVLFGLLLALKISNLMIAGPLGLWLLLRWRVRLPWKALPSCLMLTLLVGGSSYAYAWGLTGNPVLPVFNGIFHSPYFAPVNFHDDHWDSGFCWNIVWKLVFHTSRYMEGGNGGAGFVLIGLGGSLLVALFHRRARPLAWVALSAFVLPLTQIQYVRYTHPAFALLIPAMLCGVPVLADGSTRLRAVIIMLVVLVIGQLAFISATDWQRRNGALGTYLADTPRQFMSRYAPIRQILELVQERFGSSARVLINSGSNPFAAGFGGQAFVTDWYDPELDALSARANHDSSGAAWNKLIDHAGVNLLVVQSDHVGVGLAAVLNGSHASLVSQNGALQLWEVRHELAGVSEASAEGSVDVRFDTSSLPARATLAHAKLVLQCAAPGRKIVLTWNIAVENGKPWSYSDWTNCLANGRAIAEFGVAVPQQIIRFNVTAVPLKKVPMELALDSSALEVRRDLSAQRDLATRMRQGWLNTMARWIGPWTGQELGGASVSATSRKDNLVVDFDTTRAPPKASFVHADLQLACRNRAVPIVIEWEIGAQGSGLQTKHEWALCGSDGLVHASFDARTRTHISSFRALVMPSQSVDMGLQLVRARAGYLTNAGIMGIVNRKRIKLSGSLRPHNRVKRMEP